MTPRRAAAMWKAQPAPAAKSGLFKKMQASPTQLGHGLAVLVDLDHVLLLAVVLPLFGGQGCRRLLDPPGVLLVDQVGAVAAAALHELGRRPGEHALAAVAEDAGPVAGEERGVEDPCPLLFVVLETQPLVRVDGFTRHVERRYSVCLLGRGTVRREIARRREPRRHEPRRRADLLATRPVSPADRRRAAIATRAGPNTAAASSGPGPGLRCLRLRCLRGLARARSQLVVVPSSLRCSTARITCSPQMLPTCPGPAQPGRPSPARPGRRARLDEHGPTGSRRCRGGRARPALRCRLPGGVRPRRRSRLPRFSGHATRVT